MNRLEKLISAGVLGGLISCSGYAPGIVPLRDEPVPDSVKPAPTKEGSDPASSMQSTEEALMAKGHSLVESGQDKAARAVYRDYLDRYPGGGSTDEALYRLGVLALKPDEPGESRSESEQFFKKLLRDYPESPRAFEAKRLLSLLQKIKTVGAENAKLKSDMKKLLDLDIQSEKKRKALQE